MTNLLVHSKLLVVLKFIDFAIHIDIEQSIINIIKIKIVPKR
jgi:hypothetical protein